MNKLQGVNHVNISVCVDFKVIDMAFDEQGRIYSRIVENGEIIRFQPNSTDSESICIRGRKASRFRL